MNLQRYSYLYAKFHGAHSYEIKNDIIRIPLLVINDMKHATLKFINLKKLWTECDRPLMKSLKCYFKQQIPLSVFYENDNWCLLLGNEKVIYPQSHGVDFFCATKYFVHRDMIPAFHKFMLSIGGILTHTNIYYFHNMILFLDEFDIIYPGGTYLSSTNESNDWFRINFIGNEMDAIAHLSTEKTLITEMSNKSKAIETNISKFLTLSPKTISKFSTGSLHNISKYQVLSPEEIWLPEQHYKNTNVVQKDKCYDNPAYILQDILKSFPNNKSLGIIIEYPISISFQYNNVEGNRKYVGFAVNSSFPKNVVFVPYPYERYHFFNDITLDINWQIVYYDYKQKVVDQFLPVIWDNVILGYVYENTFFCLSNIKLNTSLYPDYKNTEHLFSKVQLNTKSGKKFALLNTYILNDEYALNSYKHESIEEELWCIEKKSEFTVNTIKRSVIPYLVREWSSIALDVENTVELHTCCVNYLKTMYTFVKHDICFEMVNVDNHNDEKIDFEMSKTIKFYVCKSLMEYINTFRLLLSHDNNNVNIQDADCIIL